MLAELGKGFPAESINSVSGSLTPSPSGLLHLSGLDPGKFTQEVEDSDFFDHKISFAEFLA